MGKFQKPKEKKHPEKKKQAKKYLRLTITGILVVLLAVMPMLASRNAETEASRASILSATVEEKTISTQIIGGGQLSSEASLNVRIPENVKLTQYLVGNGDTVKEGDAIAKIDKISVMTAITEVQETLDYLAEEIADASDDTASTSVKALAGGTVKVIYAREGESVQDVMLDHGALAVLSLDDTMAVKIEKETTLDVGDTVTVTLPSGTTVDGRVKTNLEGVLTITMDDDDYVVGSKVTVSTEAGNELGTGELYIFSPWSATAYSGYVEDILVDENDSVYVGQSMLTLEDTGSSAQFQRLIDQRQEYEKLMQELFTMYRTETITAPCDGIVTGVDEDGAYLLSDSGENWFASLLSFFGAEEDGFMAYAAAVTEVNDGGMELRLNPEVTYIEDLADVSGVSVDPAAMTETWDYSGDTRVYTQTENGLLTSAGTAKAGDLLLAIGDEERVHWFVTVTENSSEESDAVAAVLCSAVEPIVLTRPTEETLVEETEATQSAEEMVENTIVTEPTEQTLPDETTQVTFQPVQTPVAMSGVESGTTPSVTITPGSAEIKAGEKFEITLTAIENDSVVSGTWYCEVLPDTVTLEGNKLTGTLTASTTLQIDFYKEGAAEKSASTTLTLTVTAAEEEAAGSYRGYVAQVESVGINEYDISWLSVKRTQYYYPISDLKNIPEITVYKSALKESASYNELDITGLKAGDYILLILGTDVDGKEQIKAIVPQTATEGDSQQTDTSGTSGQIGEAITVGGSGMSAGVSGSVAGGGVSMSGMTQSQTVETYSLDKLTIASVTSQEHMTVSITVDELDITKIYVGQAVTVSVDALGGEQFDAEITQISNSGENEGGNSKFAVEVTLGKSGDMLPGMYSSAFITLETSENIPCVPVAALGKDGVDSVLYTSYDAESGTLGDPVVVTIGVSDGENVQILAGMDLGETCYYEYFDTYIGSDALQQQSGGFNLGTMMGRR